MKKVIIIGAGPAGLAAGEELGNHKIKPIILEKDLFVGGLSRTIKYKGCYLDIGGHRFFTKNDLVFSWWRKILKVDFLKRPRYSRIYYQGKFFHYPLSIINVIGNLSIFGALPILFSYLKSRLFPYPEELNFKQWVTNRFGKRLFQIFFENYTEKVWGMPCERISADWAGQRIKGLSFVSVLRNALSRKNTPTPPTLISEFYYPRLGGGMMYETAAERIADGGGELRLGCEVVGIRHDRKRITGVLYKDLETGRVVEVEGTDFCSSMPITSLVSCMHPSVDENILRMCKQLSYRGMVMVYLLVDKKQLFKDNWIYIHAPQVKVARIQNYKNWSFDMVADQDKTSLGLEYFCTEGDAFWSQGNDALKALAAKELEQLNLACAKDIRDCLVVRLAKAYPVYETGYKQKLDVIKNFVEGFPNLQCIGRYGMFHYNGMDHSVLTGLLAARNIIEGRDDDLWGVNIDQSYLGS